MRVGVPKETAEGERRVALVPDAVRRLAQRQIEVVVESGAGEAAGFDDRAFLYAGGRVTGREGVWAADAVVKVAPPSEDEVPLLEAQAVLIGFLAPLTSPDTARALAGARVSSFAMEAIPRVTRAQPMDALSSQATVSGYQAALMAAVELRRFFPMLTTAAGTVPPAKVLVLGAGVAGLQAIATARRLGAIVSGFDVRSVVREQIESLGARWLDLGLDSDAEAAGGYARELTEEEGRRQQRALAEATTEFDVVITTAPVPGRPAPRLITADTVRAMGPGSVIVDLAAEAGGNCELTSPGETIVREGVTIAGPLNLPSSMPRHASMLYARNVSALLDLLISDGLLWLNFDDEIVLGSCITHAGEVIHLDARRAVEAVKAAAPEEEPPAEPEAGPDEEPPAPTETGAPEPDTAGLAADPGAEEQAESPPLPPPDVPSAPHPG